MRIDWPMALFTLLAFSAPPLLTWSFSPSSTLASQLSAVGAWGGVLYWMNAQGTGLASVWRGIRWPVLMILGLMLAVLLSWTRGLPTSMTLEAVAVLGCAAAVLLAAQAGPGAGPLVWPALSGLVVAGVLSGLVAVVQVFFPEWADGTWIARSGLPGRAVGNLRQPNHLSTVLLWGLIAWVPLADAARQRFADRQQRLAIGLCGGLAAWMTLGVVLTASRTGVLGTLLLAVWAWRDRGLSRSTRWTLGLTPLFYLVFWLALAAWAHHTQHTFGGEARLSEGDVSASRFGIWANTLSLIKAHPWLGVGFGQFNFAWTLTPFPGRPVAFFDHTHNLLLQWAVELGLPTALLLTGLALAALWQAWRRCWHASGVDGSASRATWMMVLLVGLHSMLEYPLWYTYFLLPAAWALGHALRQPGVSSSETGSASTSAAGAPSGPDLPSYVLNLLGGLMLAGTLLAGWSYAKVVLIYQPGNSPLSLPERITQGQQSWLFAHHADYAAATTPGLEEPPDWAAFNHTTHSLLDTRLMIAWARALDAAGEGDKARYLAARLREFEVRNPMADDFFAICDGEVPGLAEPEVPPFQCQGAPASLSWRDFEP